MIFLNSVTVYKTFTLFFCHIKGKIKEEDTTMGYAIIGVNKINSLAKLNAASDHNLRQVDVPNADKSMEYKNDELVSTNGKSYGELFQEKISSLDYYKNHKPRSNAVIALEVSLSFSHEDSDKIDLEKWKKDNVEWLRGYFNKNPLTYGDNVINITYHGDESTPHIHAIVVPIDEKGKLNASAYIDGPASLRQLQTEYTAFMKERHGLERGAKYSVARHEQIKGFYTALTTAMKERSAPEIQPGDTLETYKKRVDEYAKEMNTEKFALKKQMDKERILAVNEQRTKNLNTNEAYKRTAKELHKMKRERDELIHEYGDFPVIKQKLETVECLREAFATYPDEEERERVKQDMNRYTAYGEKERKKRKREHNKEQEK